jgi:hypothetical protein
MFFGDRRIEYYIDHQDDEKNKVWLSRQRGSFTPFHKNFWVNCNLFLKESAKLELVSL